MKKFILILVILALLVPAAALGATEFSLGGYIKLDMLWDSTQRARKDQYPPARDNDALFKHGQFHTTAQESRFNFTIKGPDIWGAKTTALIEMDFNAVYETNFSGASGAVTPPSVSNSYLPRLRHAMFRLNWPETELMIGQYWTMFSEYAPDALSDSSLNQHGYAVARTPQIRLTQKFLGAWTVAGAILDPFNPANDTNFTGAATLPANSTGSELPPNGQIGRSTETPMLQGKLAYEQDLWGKAPFLGRPRGFTAQVNAGWQRLRYRANVNPIALNTFGQNAFGTTNVLQNGQQYLNPWAVEGTLFIPVLPTYSANLAGTASLTAQWWVGQGVSFLSLGRDQDNSWLDFSGRNPLGQLVYERKLMNQFGGYVQGQYYFTNQWYLNVDWGMIRNFGVDTGTSALLAGQAGNPAGFKYASNNDQQKLYQELQVVLWYRPIQAFKFGIQYAYSRSDYLQSLNNPTIGAAGQAQGQPSAGATNVGQSHRIEFAAIMFF